MSDERIINNEISQAISFTPATYKKLAVWTVHFKDGNVAMLYKCGNEWLQGNEGTLDANSLRKLGNQIDAMS